MEITGKIIAILPEQRFNGKNGEIVKNSFVIEWHDNGFTQKLCLEVIGGDKWDKMKQNVVEGNDVMVKFGVTSREWQNRWFTSCQCFYCANIGGGNQSNNSHSHVVQTAQQASAPEDDSPLPF